MNPQYDLYSKFDIDLHKKHFVNYLEIIIKEDGTAEYAVPSHQEKLIKEIQIKYNCSRDDVNNMCPKEYYFDFITWLCKKSHCLSVWNDFYYGTPNDKQKQTLLKLKQANLYFGEI